MATFTLYLPDELLKAVDEDRDEQLSRSRWIRNAIEWFLDPKEVTVGAPAPKAERSPEPDSTPEMPQEPSKAQRAEAVVKAKGLPVDRASAFRSATQ